MTRDQAVARLLDGKGGVKRAPIAHPKQKAAPAEE